MSIAEEMGALALNTGIRAFDNASLVDVAEFANLMISGGEILVGLGNTLKDGKVSPEEIDEILNDLKGQSGLLVPIATYVRKAAEQIL
jgi:hypothetical protein